ncbi:MAG: 50S ribosomal protein L17 [Saprospiraceae bacterium]|nr:50S ribosomal protein L17 [Saprospiraceae bacterium]
MRHGDKVNNLGRKNGHRRALLKNLSIAFIRHKRITTTLAKARVLRTHLEPLITKAKSNTMHNRRVVFSYLQDKESIKELFGPVAERVGDRPGGYLRILKTGFRRGDAADMAMIEFVDFNTSYVKGGDESGKKKRTRRGGRKATDRAAEITPAATTAAITTAAAATDSKGEEE